VTNWEPHSIVLVPSDGMDWARRPCQSIPPRELKYPFECPLVQKVAPGGPTTNEIDCARADLETHSGTHLRTDRVQLYWLWALESRNFSSGAFSLGTLA